MKDTALYEQLLGRKSPWSVKRVDLSQAEQRVTVEVVLKAGQVWAGPTNERARAHIHCWGEREWRHLDTCQFETVIKARVPQLKYSDGTVEELAMPWAERIEHLGPDEKSTERGHSYASILTDIGGSRVLDLVPGRTLAAATQLLDTLSPEQRAGVKAVAMDMWPAFMGAAKARLPRRTSCMTAFMSASTGSLPPRRSTSSACGDAG